MDANKTDQQERDPRPVNFGIVAARKVFAKRERGGQRRVEIHISEMDLAVILAAAFAAGQEL